MKDILIGVNCLPRAYLGHIVGERRANNFQRRLGHTDVRKQRTAGALQCVCVCVCVRIVSTRVSDGRTTWSREPKMK